MKAYPDDPFQTVLHQAGHFNSLDLCFLIYKMVIISLLREASELKQRST